MDMKDFDDMLHIAQEQIERLLGHRISREHFELQCQFDFENVLVYVEMAALGFTPIQWDNPEVREQYAQVETIEDLLASAKVRLEALKSAASTIPIDG